MERVFRKYQKSFASGGWVLSANMLRQILSLVFLMVLVRHLTQDDVGRFQLVAAAVGFAALTALPGVSNAVIQSVARGYPGTFLQTMRLRFGVSLLGGVALAIYALTYPGDSPLRPALFAAAALFPFADGLAGWTDFQSGEGNFKLNSLWQGAAGLASYGGMIVALLLGTPSIAWLVAIMYGALSAFNIAALVTVLRRIPRSAEAEPGAVRYGLETSVYSAANLAGNYIDKFLLFYFLSPATLAVFVVAERIPEILKKYIQALRVILIPGFSRKRAYTADLDRKINYVGLTVSVAIAVVALVIVPWFLPLAFTASYGNAVLYCQLLCGTLIIGQVAQTRKTFIISRLDTEAMRNITLGGNVIRIAASLILVPLFGTLGAVVSTAVYRVANVVLVSLAMRRYRTSTEVA